MNKRERVERTVSVVKSVRQKPCKPEPFDGDAIIKSIIAGGWKKEVESIRKAFNANHAKVGMSKSAKKAISNLKQKVHATLSRWHRGQIKVSHRDKP